MIPNSINLIEFDHLKLCIGKLQCKLGCTYIKHSYVFVNRETIILNIKKFRVTICISNQSTKILETALAKYTCDTYRKKKTQKDNTVCLCLGLSALSQSFGVLSPLSRLRKSFFLETISYRLLFLFL